MTSRKHSSEPQLAETSRRSVGIDLVRQSDGDTETLVFPASSELPYRRYYHNLGMELDEILDHDAKSVDLKFLNSGNAPLLDSHSTWGLNSVIGVIRKAWLKDRRVYVEVKFSDRADVRDLVSDVRSGVIRNVSIGYEVKKYEVDEASETIRATKWSPSEVSFVPIPADPSVGMGRNHRPTQREIIMTGKTDDKAVLPGTSPDELAKQEQTRGAAIAEAITEISALGESHNMGDIARSFIQGSLSRGETPSLAAFKGVVSAKIPKGTPLVNTDIGLTEKERQSFSVVRLMRAMSGEDGVGRFEVEAARAATSTMGKSSAHGGYALPTDLMDTWGRFEGRRMGMSRAPMATSGNANVLDVEHMSDRFIDNLRNQMSVMRAGATVLEGLSDSVDIPGGDANAAAAWLAAEGANAAETVPTFRKISLAPKDLAGYTDVTRRMLQQATISMEAFIRSQLIDSVALEIDRAALYGTAASGQPRGLNATSGIGSEVFAAAIPTRDEIINLRTDVASNNRGRGVTYLGNSIMVGDLQKTKVDAGSGIFLMNDSADRLVGNRFIESNQIVTGDLFAGVWEDLLIGMWGGLQLDRSTEALFLSGGIRFRVIQTVDVAVARVGSFSVGRDA